MTKLGVLVSQDNWFFFQDIYDELASHYQTEIYRRKTYATPLLYGRLNHWALREGIRSMMRRNDICFFEWAGELLMVASHMPKRCAVVTRLHSFELYDWAPRINWEVVDKVILVSQAMRQHFGHLYPAHAHKTEVVFNGVSLDKFKAPIERSSSLNLGMLGVVVPIKRVYETVLMLHSLKEQGHDAYLHIAGPLDADPRYTVAIRRLVDRLKLGDNVVLEGIVTDTPTWLSKVDVFISNSFWEGQQVSLLEAMAAGCYCLSHVWAGSEEVLPLENLYVTQSELREKIVRYFEMSEAQKQEQRARMQAIACDRFDIDQTKVQIRQAVEKVAAGAAYGNGRSG